MNTNTNTTTPAAREYIWAIREVGSHTIRVNTFRTTTDHWVEVRTREDSRGVHVSVRVQNGDAFFDACCVSFYGINREVLAADFANDYLESVALEDICEHFDEICTQFGRCEE
jgi:hypothetical protein